MVAVYDLAILGGSLAARQLAAQATGLFARVALIEPAQEDHRPAQKAAIAALNSPSAIGGRSREPSALQSQADFWDSLDWIEQLPIQEQQLLEAYAPQVLARLGVDYIPDQGKFPQIEGAPLWVQTTQRRLQARRYLIAVAEELAIPPESSIDPEAIAPLHHLESHLRPLPRSAPLAMVGDGPWTMALGQILQRRGHSIYLVAPGSLLPHEDPDAAYLLQGCLEASGIRIRTATPVEEARKTPQGVVLNTRQGQLRAALLLAPDWEKPSLKTLGLNPQQIPHGFSEEGSSLRTTPQLQTWHRQIFACGSALGGYSLPRLAEREGRIALQNMLFQAEQPVRYDQLSYSLPVWPGFVRVGLTEPQARRRFPSETMQITVQRSQGWGETWLFCKLVMRATGEIVGIHLVGHTALQSQDFLEQRLKSRCHVAELAQLEPSCALLREGFQAMAQRWQQVRDPQVRGRLERQLRRLRGR